MGYTILKCEEVIDILRDDPLAETHIVFYTNKKKIIGFLKPLKNLFDINDMSHIYKLYRDMQKDLKLLAEKARYEIV